MCRREGFFVAGYLPQAGQKFGRTLDLVLLQRFLRVRAGVVLRDHAGRVLWIRRELEGRTWWILPGGGMEAGERPEEAAGRELREEAGLDVALGPVGYRVFHHGRLELYFQGLDATPSAGGATGPEHAATRQAERGTYTPEWLDPAAADGRTLIPAPVAGHLAAETRWPTAPVTFFDDPVPPATRPWADVLV